MYIITPQCGITITRKTTFNKKIVSKQSWLTSIWKDSPLFFHFTDNFDLEDIKRESACRHGLSLVTVPCWWDGAVRTYASFFLSCSHLISLPPPLLDLRLRLHPSSPSYIAVCLIDQRWLSSYCYNSYSPCLSVYSWSSTSPSYLWPALTRLTIVDHRWRALNLLVLLSFALLFFFISPWSSEQREWHDQPRSSSLHFYASLYSLFLPSLETHYHLYYSLSLSLTSSLQITNDNISLESSINFESAWSRHFVLRLRAPYFHQSPRPVLFR